MLKRPFKQFFSFFAPVIAVMGCLLFSAWLMSGETAPQTAAEIFSRGLAIFTETANADELLPQKKFLKPEEAFIPSLQQDNDKIKITFEIADRYYLYQEKFKLVPRNCAISNIRIPGGILHDDEYMGESHIFYEKAEIEAELTATNPLPQLLVTYQGCTEGLCYPPVTTTLNIRKISKASETAGEADTGTQASGTSGNPTQESSVTGNTAAEANTSDPINSGKNSTVVNSDNASDIYQKIHDSGFIAGLMIFFALGLLMSLTPCMFPMYPIWSAIIIGGHKKNFVTAFWYSFLYIQGMALTYMLIGFGIAYAGTKLHAIIQHPLILIVLSLIFIVLAASMFGLFELTLPEKLLNRLQSFSDKQKGGTLLGVCAMGALSAVIASPCTTAPLAGALMFIMQDGSLLKGGIYLYIMALGMGTPLFVIGLFGQKCLPRTGNWTVIIKTVCGFLLLSVPLILLQRYMTSGVLTALSVLLVTSLFAYLAYALPKTHKKVFTGATALCGIALAFAGWWTLDIEEAAQTEQIFTEVKTPAEFHEILKNNPVVILDFRADWCRTCIMYEKTTFKDQEVRKELLKSTPVFADITSEEAPAHNLLNEFEVTGVPTILIFKNGRLTKKITGYKNAGEFLAELRR